MISQSQVKLVHALKLAKYREQKQLFIAEGPKVVGELLSGPFQAEMIFATRPFYDNLVKSVRRVNLFEISEKELLRVSLLKTPNQVLGIFRMAHPAAEPPEIVEDLTLLLEGISDPGNLGTIIRTADWYGIRYLMCSQNCVDVYNPKVVQATMGSLARVTVSYTDTQDYLESLSGKTETFAAVIGARSVYEMQLPRKSVLVIGSESHGIPQNLLSLIKNKISIPPFNSGNIPSAESLNASIAAAILCSEFRRQASQQE